MTILIDILLILSIVLVAYLGWSAGLVRSFFAVCAGFIAMFAASKYPYQQGVNFYLVFVLSAVFVIAVAGFVLRLVEFFFLKTIDKAGGAVLSVAVWLIVSINVVIPTLTHGTHALEGPTQNTLYKIISENMHKQIPTFKDYVPPMLEQKILERQRKQEI